MTPEQRVAFILSQVACANARIAGMVAENQQRIISGESMAYPQEAFDKVAAEFGIDHNSVLGFFQQ